MTTAVNIDERNPTLRELLEQAAPGDEVVVHRGGKIVARLTREPADIAGKPKIQWGFLQGRASISDDYFEPMSERELAEWYDGTIPGIAHEPTA